MASGSDSSDISSDGSSDVGSGDVSGNDCSIGWKDVSGWTMSGVLIVILLVTAIILVFTCYKYRAIKKQLNKRKAQDLQISNPINTQQVHTPWDTREGALSEVRDQVTGEGRSEGVSNETEAVTQEGAREGERVGERQQQTQEEQTTTARYMERVNFRNEERDRGDNVVPTSYLIQSQGNTVQRSTATGHRDMSGSVSSARYDYADSPEGWVSHRYRIRGPPESEPPRHITQLESEGTGEDYVHMSSVTSNSMFLTQMLDMSLERVMEESVWKEMEDEAVGDEDNTIVTSHKFPADYEDPVPSQTVTNTCKGSPNPLLGHKGPTVPPVIPSVTPTASGASNFDNAKIVSKRYMNINVSSYSSMIPPIHTSSDSPLVSQQDSKPLVEQQQSTGQASVESPDEDETVPPAISVVAATASGASNSDNAKIPSKRYMNINVSSFFSMIPTTDQASVESSDEDETNDDCIDNIDGYFLPQVS